MFPLFIAQRYLFSRKSTHAINLISGISVGGIAIACCAMVVVLSVFNGIRDIVAGIQTNFDPQLKIVAAEGKTFAVDDQRLEEVKALDAVSVATECLEEMVVANYRGNQLMVTLKGVDDNFADLTHVEECLYGSADFSLRAGALEYAVVGCRAAQLLGSDVFRAHDYIRLYAAQREGQLDMSAMDEAFVLDSLMIRHCVFSVKQGVYDKGYILAPIAFARRLFAAEGEASSLELRLRSTADISATKKTIRKMLGDDYLVLDRFEQQADTFRIMQVEKLIAYAFLTFILIVACFNLIGSLSMLLIDKREDTATLSKLGASTRQLRQVFLFEGWLISLIGALVGIGAGLLLCLLQQQYGLVAMGKSNTYIVEAYPVSVHYGDVALIFITVLIVAGLAVYYPVSQAIKPTRE